MKSNYLQIKLLTIKYLSLYGIKHLITYFRIISGGITESPELWLFMKDVNLTCDLMWHINVTFPEFRFPEIFFPGKFTSEIQVKTRKTSGETY